ncbi:hypothetical protein EZV62_026656 [Acer yangbiense]|uniref:Uncharacterized protein n=1 Tax=Acer yangbiense TaxID=1000413 RepID=A0A5C7GSR1_9ROSI|nr:hypothetical protein EZV62_026656 [Acer yangbiense]
MKAFIFVNSINNYSNPLIISPHNYFPFRFPSLSLESNQRLIRCISRAKWLPNPRTSNLSPVRVSSSSSADSAGYGGWYDLRFGGSSGGDSTDSSESTRFRNFLVSIGIYDKQHVFTFVLGIVCAHAISRVRVSSIIVFPATVLVFAVGLSFGFVRGGCLNASKRRSKEDIFRVYSDKLKSLVEIFDGFDGKVSKLKSDIQRAIYGKKVVNSKPNKVKDNVKQGTVENVFMNNCASLNMGCTNGAKAWESHNNLLDSMDFRVGWKHMESETSFVQEQVLKKSNEAYRSSDDNDNEIYRSRFRVFDRYVTEANYLLKQAKECIRSSSDQEHAEIILYNSAKLLSKATAMKPMILLGNTYLLHGGLKLRISRELRSILSRSDPLSVEKQKRVLNGLDYQLASKDEIATVLVNVCEECEELLVKTGRKYRFALSIDGNDVRALYNWGLALSFHAQLIADIGLEAAFDADKVFLAAIDKFDSVYAPDALFRWGAVLQQRSRLWPSNSKEKVKLLQQAIRLYEDALHMDSNNLQVRDALLSCMSELDYIRF